MDDERKARVLLQTEFDDSLPRVSPDGRWMAYQSNTSGRREIYVRPFPDVEAGRRQVSTGGGAEPLWGPKSEEFFYRSATSLMAVPVESGATPTLGSPTALFDLGRYAASTRRDYDIAPTGDRFILAAPITSERGTSAQIIVVENWLAELAQRVPIP